MSGWLCSKCLTLLNSQVCKDQLNSGHLHIIIVLIVTFLYYEAPTKLVTRKE